MEDLTSNSQIYVQFKIFYSLHNLMIHLLKLTLTVCIDLDSFVKLYSLFWGF